VTVWPNSARVLGGGVGVEGGGDGHHTVPEGARNERADEEKYTHHVVSINNPNQNKEDFFAF
jgi:hypothetical protein